MTFNMEDTGGRDHGFSLEQRAQLEEMMSTRHPGKREQKKIGRRAARQRIAGIVQSTVDTAIPPDKGMEFDRGTLKGRVGARFSRSAVMRAALGIAVIAVVLIWCGLVFGAFR